MSYYVYDTNTLSHILRGTPSIRSRAEAVSFPDVVLGCPVVWYELRRGLLAKDARRQMTYFERLFSNFIWDDLTLRDWNLAGDLWAGRRRRGLAGADADLLIAAFCRNRQAVLGTDNERDFDGLGLQVENWLG